MNCWFTKPKCIIQLGAFGDLIILLPAFREIYNRTGQKPNIIVSDKYASVLDGVSYVTPYPIPVHWVDGMEEAKRFAKEQFGEFVIPIWWNDKTFVVPPKYRGSFILQYNGRTYGINRSIWPNFMVSMWERLGFTQEEMMTLPLVFDLRTIRPTTVRKKPLLLYNFTGISSPFGYLDAVWPVLQGFSRDFQIVDLGKIKAPRIYDLLDLYDEAVGLLTCDTATLQLASASTVPYIAWTQNGFLGSTPRGNCVLQIPYDQTLRRLTEVRKALELWRNAVAQRSPLLVSQHT